MLIIDAHCDSITKIMENNSNLFSNTNHCDIQRLKQTGSYVQFFAAFISPIYTQAYSLRRTLEIIDKYYSEINTYSSDIMHCENYQDVIQAHKDGKVAAILSIEDGSALQGKLSSLRMLYKLGVRSICLTWNNRNEIADGVKETVSHGGLTTFGKDVIAEMNVLGMIIDVSHLSERGFWDVAEASRRPFIASHSNAQVVCNHKRNLTNEQLLQIKKSEGVVGINFYPPFLKETGIASIVDVIRNIEHISSVIGCDHIGLGSDFDGIDSCPISLNGVEDTPKIFNELAKLNYSEEQIEKIAGLNMLKIINKIL